MPAAGGRRVRLEMASDCPQLCRQHPALTRSAAPLRLARLQPRPVSRVLACRALASHSSPRAFAWCRRFTPPPPSRVASSTPAPKASFTTAAALPQRTRAARCRPRMALPPPASCDTSTASCSPALCSLISIIVTPSGALTPLHSVCLCCIRLTPAVLWFASSWSCDAHTPSPSSARLHAARCLRKPPRAISSPSSRWW